MSAYATEVRVIALAGQIDPGTVIALQRKDHRGAEFGSRSHPRVRQVLASCDIHGVELYPTVTAALAPSQTNPTARSEIAVRPTGLVSNAEKESSR